MERSSEGGRVGRKTLLRRRNAWGCPPNTVPTPFLVRPALSLPNGKGDGRKGLLITLLVQGITVKVAIKYCGSCNPRINLARLGQRLAALAEAEGVALVSPEGEMDAIVILNGCRVACADQDEVRRLARRAVVVSETSVNGLEVAEADLAQAVMLALRDAPCQRRVQCQR